MSLIYARSGVGTQGREVGINEKRAEPALGDCARLARMPRLPARPIERVTKPFTRFLHIESASGIVLLVCTAFAVVAGNTELAEHYHRFWAGEFRIGVTPYELSYPLWYWVNDALMTVFFFVIGLEIKRELVTGELREPRRVVLPIAAAAGGVIVPVSIYLSLQHGEAGQDGWAIPMATDIAFVVGCLALLGKRVPHGLKVLMLSLAIVDDLIAVLVIAVFYTETIHVTWGAVALGGLGFIVLMRSVEIRHAAAYLAVGGVIWLGTLKSGVHPTIAGVLLGLLTPTTAWLDLAAFSELLRRALESLQSGENENDAERRAILSELDFAATEAVSPLARIETALHPWVAFGIMPVFALANAAVPVSTGALLDPIAVAVAAGLFIGKPMGIFGASWLAVQMGLAKLPNGVTWLMLFGAGCLGGIGFTMALFIASLGLEGAVLDTAKAGILSGSLLSAIVGMGALLYVFRKSS